MNRNLIFANPKTLRYHIDLINDSLSKFTKVDRILLETTPKSVKFCQAVSKTLTVVYMLFAAYRDLTGKEKKFKMIDNFE